MEGSTHSWEAPARWLHLRLVEERFETLNVLSDPEMVLALRESIEDLKHGRRVSNAEAKKRLG